MAKLVTLASTDPQNPRRMIRFVGADWFTGFDGAALADAILSGIGDATPQGVELVNQTISAKLIASGDGAAVQAWDPITETHVPMPVSITLRITRAPATQAEYARVRAAAEDRKNKSDAKKTADAKARAEAASDVKESFKEGYAAHMQQSAQQVAEAPKPNLTGALRDAAELISVVQQITAATKSLPAAE